MERNKKKVTDVTNPKAVSTVFHKDTQTIFVKKIFNNLAYKLSDFLNKGKEGLSCVLREHRLKEKSAFDFPVVGHFFMRIIF